MYHLKYNYSVIGTSIKSDTLKPTSFVKSTFSATVDNSEIIESIQENITEINSKITDINKKINEAKTILFSLNQTLIDIDKQLDEATRTVEEYVKEGKISDHNYMLSLEQRTEILFKRDTQMDKITRNEEIITELNEDLRRYKDELSGVEEKYNSIQNQNRKKNNI
ncbi:hypothetical protein RF11_11832 [Thelohanellus kitauei]|uniref:Uncharacterized protein n=1 Tax=Thelohanellus kitauei TaxID=669202 RepID=A0A0C2NE92_THEKT|nr:hypothetical protein RF11_11832 [Thelohanellus kitauei]